MTSNAIWLRRLTATTTAGGMLLLGAPVVMEYADPPDAQTSGCNSPQGSPAFSLVASGQRKHRVHPGRRILHYTVKPGDTATGLAVRYHAWTDELLMMNHLTAGSTLYIGDRIRIPVVLSAVRKARHQQQARPHDKPSSHPNKRPHHKTHAAHQWRNADPSRAKVRRIIIRTAQRHGVNPNLALAISWQEAGWQMHHVSSAQAIGAMQVIPSTGRWMSQVVGRRLHLYRVHDNVTAGVVLIKVLRQEARLRHAIAGYYQGLAGVRAFGMYDSTKAYVANVLALKKMLAHGWSPA